MSNSFSALNESLEKKGVTLVAVSKKKPVSDILSIYEQGHRDFGENRVQELLDKKDELPDDIKWHLIGHLQRNKVKYIVPFVHLVHSVDSFRLLKKINKEAGKAKKVVDGLLQVKIAKEDSKYGWEKSELLDKLKDTEGFAQYQNIRLRGLMGMATFTEDEEQIRQEFKSLNKLFREIKETYFSDDPDFSEISTGMSGDYKIALDQGSTMVRIGSLIFGPR